MEDFAARREAFTALGFPWRRGFLLIGPPGMGKTMACRGAAAALHDRPFLYVRDCQSGHGAGALQIIFARARRLPPASSPSRTLTGWRKSAAMARRCSAFALDCTSRQGRDDCWAGVHGCSTPDPVPSLHAPGANDPMRRQKVLTPRYPRE
ncbi:MAG TPA: AAA family ATPase [Thermomicrobiales bacterium]|nr:AAA family ATPase [Thermomicrobiales bacterium]